MLLLQAVHYYRSFLRGEVSKSEPFPHNRIWNKLQDLLTPNITTANVMCNTIFSNVIHSQLKKKSSAYFASLEITELLEAN